MPSDNNVAESNPSCWLYGPGDARFGDRPIPQIADSKDVIVHIRYVGVCGSDVHFWTKGGVGTVVSPHQPLVMGHEAVGIVTEVGSAVKDLRPGSIVALEPGIPCRTCARCREGQYNLCPDMRFAACPPDVHGCLTKFYKLPEDFCHQLPSGLALENGVLVEPLAVAVHACRLVGVTPNTSVVVFGAGTVGLLSAAVAKAFGARTVGSVDIAPRKVKFAMDKKFSDFSWIPSRDHSAESVARDMGTLPSLASGVDVVIETSGAATAANISIHLLRNGGSFVQVGMGEATIDFPILGMTMKELHLHGCFRYGPGDFELAIGLLRSGKINLDGMVTSIRPFEQATEAWEATRMGNGIKNVIEGPR